MNTLRILAAGALALAVTCAATMARAETLQVRPNNPGRGDTVTIAPASGAGSGAAPASAPSNPYANSPYSAPPSNPTVMVRPPPDYRANAAQLGVSQATLDFLIAQVKARILADANYITEEPPSVGPAGLPNYPPNEYPPYWYNGGVPPSGDQLEADANYLVERALATGLNSPGTSPTARLSEVLKQLSDPQYPPGYFTDNPNYKPPVPSEQAGSDDTGNNSQASAEDSGNGTNGANNGTANQANAGNPSDGTNGTDNQASSSAGTGSDQVQGAGNQSAGTGGGQGQSTGTGGGQGQSAGNQGAGSQGTGTGNPNTDNPSALKAAASKMGEQGILGFTTSIPACLAAKVFSLGECVKRAGINGGIGAVCQGVQDIAQATPYVNTALAEVPLGAPALSLVCASVGSYRACILAGKDPQECSKDTGGSLPPNVFCAALGLLALEATPVVAAGVSASCGILAGGAWDVIQAYADVDQKQETLRLLGLIYEPTLTCDFQEALDRALELQKPIPLAPWLGGSVESQQQIHASYLKQTLPNLQRIIDQLTSQANAMAKVNHFVQLANDPTNDALQRQELLSMAYKAGVGIIPIKCLPKVPSSTPQPKTASSTGGGSSPPAKTGGGSSTTTGTNVVCGYTTVPPGTALAGFSQDFAVAGTCCPAAWCLNSNQSPPTSTDPRTATLSGGQCNPNQTKGALFDAWSSSMTATLPLTTATCPAVAATPPPSAAVSAPVSPAAALTPMSPAPIPYAPAAVSAAPSIRLSPNNVPSGANSGNSWPQGSMGNQGSPATAGQPSSATTPSTSSPSNPTSATGTKNTASLGGQQPTASRSQTTTTRSSSSRQSGGYAQTRSMSGWSRGGGRGGGFGGGGGRFSDIRLKEDIVPVGRLDNGIGVYRFRYRGNDHTTYVGVMAQEVRTIAPDAVSRGRDGYLRVDYDKLGLEFLTWDEWLARGSSPSATMQ